MIVLRPDQEEAKRRALEHDGFCLFMEQRVGKTIVACSIVETRQPPRLLVVCPVIAMEVWERWIGEFGLTCEYQIINLEALWSQRRKLRRWSEDGFVIVDEAQRIKGRNSKMSRALRLIGRWSRWRLALTGTPIEKGIWNVWPIFNFIEPELFGKWSEFRERYLVMGGFMGYKIVGTRNDAEFQQIFESRYHRVLLEDIKETPTVYDPPNLIVFDLVESAAHYRSMEERFRVEIEATKSRPRLVRDVTTGAYIRQRKQILAPMILSQTMKLHQLSGGFILDNDDESTPIRIGWEKMAHCGALLLKLDKVPTVIFTRFRCEMFMVAAMCRRLGRTVSIISRHVSYDTSFTTDIAILQIRSALSIDLARAEEAIFYSWGYSSLDYDQAKSRILSLSSRRARYHYLIARNTRDEALYTCVTQKISLAKLVLDRHRQPV